MITETIPPVLDPPKRRRLPSTMLLVIVAVVAMLAAVGVFVAVLLTGSAAQSETAAVKQDTAPAVLTLDQLCKRADQLGIDLRNAGACGAKVDKAKSAVDASSTPAPATPGIDRDQVVAIVQAQIAGKAVTVDQVMQLVAQVYAQHPPAAGQNGADAPAPTADQVLAAVTTVCGSTKCQGPKGDNGADAPPVTDDQLKAQVAAYCANQADGTCKGAQGAKGDMGQTGPPGTSVISVEFQWVSNTECDSVVNFSNATTTRNVAGLSACDPSKQPPPGS
jgi:hypothetical protein